MQQIYVNGYFKGYNRLMKYISDIARHPQRLVIEERIRILAFFDEFGAKATKQAFGKGRSTIFLWKHKINASGGRLSALAPGSTTPHHKRQLEAGPRQIAYIRQYRLDHPGVTKETIKPELDEYCLVNGLKLISESSIGRVISHLKKIGQIPKTNKVSLLAKTGRLVERPIKKKPKKLRVGDYRPQLPGDLVQVDAITKFVLGTKRYLVTGIDVRTRFAFALSYKTLSSSTAQDFMTKFQQVAPFPIRRVQTDNGQEFHKYFKEYIQAQDIIHFWNYPRSPKMNAFVERFNGVIQSQYIDWHLPELIDTDQFNHGLVTYLLWYNTKKQHKSLGKVPPLKYYLDTFINNTQKSNMLWTTTTY